jgi:predicted nucleic acid-binding protein
MAWVADTCLLIDVAEADPQFGVASANLLDRLRADGLVTCPVTYVELAPLFNADEGAQQRFLHNPATTWLEPWTMADTREAYVGWHRYVADRRAGATARRPIADVLIGAFAMRFQGLLTRNEADFRQVFPALKILTP